MAIQLAAAVIGGAASAIGGLIGAAAARKAKRRAARRVRKLNAKLENLEENRQEIINPYDNVESLADNMSNPFTQLGVATQATAMQVEQTDIALANTLDMLQATGSSAGGADARAGGDQYKQGLVPEGNATHNNTYLRKDGTWGTPIDTNTDTNTFVNPTSVVALGGISNGSKITDDDADNFFEFEVTMLKNTKLSN